MSVAPRRLPRRLQGTLRARTMFGVSVAAMGGLDYSLGGSYLGIATGVAALLINIVWLRVYRRRDVSAAPPMVGPQVVLDSLLAVAAVIGLRPLGSAVEFCYFFPLFVATLLSPRGGLFVTAGICGLGHLAGSLARPLPQPNGVDPLLAAMLESSLLCGALLTVALILNFLVRTLAGVESDLAVSEAKYRDLASGLEDEVRQRTRDLRRANEELNQRNRELTRLRDIDAAIHASTELGTVLQHVVDGVAELLPQAEAAILLCEPDGAHLRLWRFSAAAERRVAALEALTGQPVSQVRLDLRPGSPAEAALQSGEPLYSETFGALLSDQFPDQRADWIGQVQRILGFAGVLALPLAVGEHRLGVLAVGLREALPDHDQVRAGAFATQAAMALVRVRHERDLLEQQAALEQAYRELQRSQEQVINLEKMRAIGEMTSGVAHNFNNALTAILGTAQVILMEELPQPVAHRLRIIERTAQDAAALVQRIRAFTKDEVPTTSSTDLNELVRDAVAMTEPRWKHHADRTEFPINVDLQLEARQRVDVDAAAIREVLLNLILNGVKAMPRGGRIVCRTWDDGEQVRVTVSDTGIGMNEETRQRCFEPFFTTDQETGTGLGLSVAYGIIQRHRGEIRVTSSIGRGSEFHIALPAAQHAEMAAYRQAIPELESEPAGGNAMHVLVVDDQAMVRQTIAEMLAALGHNVTMAQSGQDALETFDPRTHDMVITDWGMPGMSGLALARSIKAISPRTPVLLVTGHDATLPQEVVDAAEITARLQKPVALQELQAAMTQLGGQARAAQG